MPGRHSPNYIISDIIRKPIRNSQAMSARSSIKASMGTPRFAFFFEKGELDEENYDLYENEFAGYARKEISR